MKNGQIVVRKMMNLSSSFDHRGSMAMTRLPLSRSKACPNIRGAVHRALSIPRDSVITAATAWSKLAFLLLLEKVSRRTDEVYWKRKVRPRLALRQAQVTLLKHRRRKWRHAELCRSTPPRPNPQHR